MFDATQIPVGAMLWRGETQFVSNKKTGKFKLTGLGNPVPERSGKSDFPYYYKVLISGHNMFHPTINSARYGGIICFSDKLHTKAFTHFKVLRTTATSIFATPCEPMDMEVFKKFITDVASLKMLNIGADIDDIVRMMQELQFIHMGKHVIIVNGEVRVI